MTAAVWVWNPRITLLCSPASLPREVPNTGPLGQEKLRLLVRRRQPLLSDLGCAQGPAGGWAASCSWRVLRWPAGGVSDPAGYETARGLSGDMKGDTIARPLGRSMLSEAEKSAGKFVDCVLLRATAGAAARQRGQVQVNQFVDDGEFHIVQHRGGRKRIVVSRKHRDISLLAIQVPVDISKRLRFQGRGVDQVNLDLPVVQIQTLLPGLKGLVDEAFGHSLALLIFYRYGRCGTCGFRRGDGSRAVNHGDKDEGKNCCDTQLDGSGKLLSNH